MVDPLIAMLRRDEQDTFDSQCRITRPASGEGTLDAEGDYQPPAPTEVYSGPCSFLPTATVRTVRSVDFAGSTAEIHPYTVKVPANTDVRVDDTVKITACPDEQAVGRFLTVASAPVSQWQINRMLGCEEGVQ